MAWISPAENKNTGGTFNSLLKEAGDWRSFLFLTGLKEQSMLVEGPTPRRKSYISFVYYAADKSIRIFRVGVKLWCDLRDLDFAETDPCQFWWRARASMGYHLRYATYEIQRNTSNLDIEYEVPNIEQLQRSALLSLSRVPLEVDFRRLDNREVVRVPIVGSSDLGDRILDLDM
jgi:hypothetical protein